MRDDLTDAEKFLYDRDFTTTPIVYSPTCYICNDPDFAQMGLPLCYKCKCGGHMAADNPVCDDCGFDGY